jgi:hypothetical protein
MGKGLDCVLGYRDRRFSLKLDTKIGRDDRFRGMDINSGHPEKMTGISEETGNRNHLPFPAPQHLKQKSGNLATPVSSFQWA